MYNNYYNILNISKLASQEEIKVAFKKMAIMYHPDKNSSSVAEAKFKKINEAYEVLKDPLERKHYDKWSSCPININEENKKKEENRPSKQWRSAKRREAAQQWQSRKQSKWANNSNQSRASKENRATQQNQSEK